MTKPARVVLARSGDLLIVGNATVDGEDQQLTEALAIVKDRLGLVDIVALKDDIEVALDWATRVPNPFQGPTGEACLREISRRDAVAHCEELVHDAAHAMRLLRDAQANADDAMVRAIGRRAEAMGWHEVVAASCPKDL